MAFELIKKQARKKDLEENSIRITKNRILFGLYVGQQFTRRGFVEIYVDKNALKVGLKPSTDAIKGFKVAKKGEDRYVSCTTSFTKRIAVGEYVLNLEDGLYVFEVSDIASASENGK